MKIKDGIVAGVAIAGGLVAATAVLVAGMIGVVAVIEQNKEKLTELTGVDFGGKSEEKTTEEV